MFKKIKDYLAGRKVVMAQLAEGKKMKEYHEKLKMGSLFLQYIYENQKQNATKMNRAERRRFHKELEQKGRFSREIIGRYMEQVDNILLYIEEGMQEVKKTQVRKLVQKELKKIKAKK